MNNRSVKSQDVREETKQRRNKTMKIAGISFTRAGSEQLRKILGGLQNDGEVCRGYISKRFLTETEDAWIQERTDSVGDWTLKHFEQADALIYVGAVGIAVRAIAPYLKDKMTDPAVLAVDEQGHFVISLLSGHVGGANRLTERIADMIGAQSVVTTASDVQGKTAIDEWAKERNLVISDRELAKKIAGAIVDGEKVGFFSDFPVEGGCPNGYENQIECEQNVWVTDRLIPTCALPLSLISTLRLIPQFATLGIGCRKETPLEAIRTAVIETLEKENLDLRSVRQIASIDLKREEAGLIAFAREQNLPFVTYSSDELLRIEGDFTESAFVRQVTGVGNVCERSAILGASQFAEMAESQKKIRENQESSKDKECNHDNYDAQKKVELVIRKTACNGVTVAVARADLSILPVCK